MAENEQSGGDRTEAATQRHLDHARDEGQVPVSREVATFVTLAAVLLVLTYDSQGVLTALLPHLVMFLSRADDTSLLRETQLAAVSSSLVYAMLPTAGAASVAAIGAVMLQTKFLLTLSAPRPKISRVNPVTGLTRIFGLKGFAEVIKSLVKLMLFTAAIWVAIHNDMLRLIHLPWRDARGLPSEIAQPIFHVLVASACAQGIVAAADFMWVRFRHAQDLRMSKQDLRDELKDTEGNPHVKARINRIRMIRARKRMMARVPGATVVVTNPTHYAVALAYDRAQNPAPRIVAKGADAIAARIREVAEANGIPLVANPVLARALYRLELDTEIPAEHYKAVAEIIAYVWRLRQPGQAVS